MVNIQLYVEKQLWDVDKKSIFSLQKEFSDETELIVKEIEYSYTLSIPTSQRNRKIFGFKDTFDVPNKFSRIYDAELYVNEIGGIDSFNFTHEEVIERKIDDLATYNINPIRPFGDTLEIERVLSKKNEITKVLSTNQVDKHTAEWLNELSKSMYTFQYQGGSHRFKIIIVDKFDITTNNTSEEFELELEYHDSDNNV